jgi:signal transduction histidine kinase
MAGIGNAFGHATGVVLFGVFLYLMLVRRREARSGGGRLAIAAAALALLWNLTSWLVLITGANSAQQDLLAAAGFSVLSLLPAVLLELCLENRSPRLVRAGYALSAVAVGAHASELVIPSLGDTGHRAGLWAITLGFGTLAILAAVVRRREPPAAGAGRIVGVMALFLFAMSFVHFGDGGPHQAWSGELAVHHAGIPLALLVLLQDYRFVLADAFIRVAANGLVALLLGAGAVRVSSGWSATAQVAAVTVALVAFAVLRDPIQHLLARTVFGQASAAERARLLEWLRMADLGEEQYVGEACRRMAALMKAPLAGIETGAGGVSWPAPVGQFPEGEQWRRSGGRIAVPIRLSHGEVRYALLGERRGGRGYLSEDLEELAQLASAAGAQVDRIRESELRRLVRDAELRALHAQIHPHFLFNAFNTLYGVIPREAPAARELVMNLADVFRYFLRSDRVVATLEEELRIVRAYLAIEELRLGARLQTEIDIEPEALAETIPALTLEPLVENAVKHGVARVPAGGLVRVEARREAEGLRLRVTDNGPGFSETGGDGGSGVGLDNVRRRLQLRYGKAAQLEVESAACGTTVTVFAPRAGGEAEAMENRVDAHADR